MYEFLVTVAFIVVVGAVVLGLMSWGWTDKLCSIPFCRYERQYGKLGRGLVEGCEHTMDWKHFNKHLICRWCGGDGT